MTAVESALPSDDVIAQRALVPNRVAHDSRFASLWTLYTLTLRQHLRGKRWLVVSLLLLLPAGMAVLVRATAHNVPPIALEFLLAQMFIPQALLPFVALLYASGMVLDEQEEQTITYLLIRPIPKWALYIVKLLATLTTTVCLVAVFTAVTYAAIYFGAGAVGENAPLRCLKTSSIHSLAIIAYCSLFGLLSLVTTRILVVGIVYAAVVEGMLANLPFGIRLVTVIYYARVIAYRTMAFIVPSRRGADKDFAAEAWQFDVRQDPTLAEHPSVFTCVAVLLVASLVCTLLAAWLCSRREFHVKTPEKE
jgi:ABC-2 type transport system permease protein